MKKIHVGVWGFGAMGYDIVKMIDAKPGLITMLDLPVPQQQTFYSVFLSLDAVTMKKLLC